MLRSRRGARSCFPVALLLLVGFYIAWRLFEKSSLGGCDHAHLQSSPSDSSSSSSLFRSTVSDASSLSSSLSTDTSKIQPSIYYQKPIPPLRTREDLGALLNSEGLTRGAELGVLKGAFAGHTIKHWTNCAYYLLVDSWQQLENYVDLNNKDNQTMNRYMNLTFVRLAKYNTTGRVKVCRGFTTVCAQQIPNESLDYVYVDARHDYKGALLDLEAWWPKLRHNGIMAGHDFIDAAEIRLFSKSQRWDVNFDGLLESFQAFTRFYRVN